MKVELLGGFGEKGRTSLAVCGGGRRILLDVGIKVGATGADYYPALGGSLDNIDAILISHAHEDHVGALSHLLARGYRGPVFMTAETRDEAPATLASYAERHEFESHPLPADRIEIFSPGDELNIGGLGVRTGHSGHVAGGVWFSVSDAAKRISYCADVVPDSAVFRMDPIPECDLLVLDASYGADPVSTRERIEQIVEWIDGRPGGCLLPTPLSGRSLELVAAFPGRFFIHAGMRRALEGQLAGPNVFKPGARDHLGLQLARAIDWMESEDLPDAPLLCHDGMGTAGPASRLIARAEAEGYPILLTGHLPEGSPGYLARRGGRAGWIRMPTHPTLSGNVRIWQNAGKPAALGHSCPAADLEQLRTHIPSLRTAFRTGDGFELGGLF